MRTKPLRRPPFWTVLFIFALLAGCVSTPGPAAVSTATAPTAVVDSAAVSPTAPPPAPTATVTPIPVPSIWLPEYLPAQLRVSFAVPDGYTLSANEASATLRFDAANNPSTGSVSWVYALVAPFPTVTDGITQAELRALWNGITSGLPVKSLLVDESTWVVLESQFGKPGRTVRVLDNDQLLETAWKTGDTWAIVPFEDLEPRWKVLAVSGQSPVQEQFEPDRYALSVPFALFNRDGNPRADIPLPPSNRDPEKLTTVVVTGVTALVRATAGYMQQFGMTYPAEEIGDLLREADILHISNEVAFAKNCPAPLPWEGLEFCSQTRNIELLESIGTDVVDLSGDHFKDWGVDAMNHTLDLYEERGWQTYGGGRNIEAARQPAKFEVNGNKIAFIGCNAKEIGYSTAAKDTPGAIHCDMSEMKKTVQQLKKEGYLPIVTFQHMEYESYNIYPSLEGDFKAMAEAGAVIVSGTQAHQPHGMSFHRDGFLHFGLGNLFFDQLKEGTPMRQAFIDRHIFYNGRYISTELITIWFVDYAKARFMEPGERADLLRTIFDASGWKTR